MEAGNDSALRGIRRPDRPENVPLLRKIPSVKTRNLSGYSLGQQRAACLEQSCVPREAR